MKPTFNRKKLSFPATGQKLRIYNFFKEKPFLNIDSLENVSQYFHLYRNLLFSHRLFNLFTYLLLLGLPIYLWAHREKTKLSPWAISLLVLVLFAICYYRLKTTGLPLWV